MKKFMTFTLGLSLLIGAVSVTLASDSSTTKTSKTKGKNVARKHDPILTKTKKTDSTTTK
jgi:hypothetical protein